MRPGAHPITRTTPTGAQLTLTRLDAEITSALLRGVRRRPGPRWDAFAKRHTRPAGKMPNRLLEAADAGEDMQRLEAEMIAAVVRMFALIAARSDGHPRAA